LILEIIFSLSVFLFAFDGEEWNIYGPVEINILKDVGHPHCLSTIACSFVSEGTVYINYAKFDKRDSCGRDPLNHELLHHIYDPQGIPVHQNCDITAPLILVRTFP